jgi:hypothetical protein
MKKLVLVAGLAALATACSTHSISKPAPSVATTHTVTTAPAVSKSSAGPADCKSLVGSPAMATVSCTLDGTPYASLGSGGCYDANGTQAGSFYYAEGQAVTIYGKDAGTFKSGPAGMSISAIASALGC